MDKVQKQHGSKTRLLNATLDLIRTKGYAATTVDDVCAAADLTKGSFFHHFASKEELAVAAAGHWSIMTGGLFASASYQSVDDPLERLLAYVDFRKSILGREVPQFTCFAGTLVQEIHQTHPAIRDAAAKAIRDHAATLEPMIEAAIEKYGAKRDFTARSLALYTQAAIQGAFILAKAEGSAEPAKDCLDHLRRYVELLFQQSLVKKGEKS